MICSTADGEPLRVKLRPGNAAANHIGDHLEVLDAAVDMLPGADAAGHRDGDDAGLVQRALVVRIDAGGCSATLAAGLAKRNIGFAVSARSTPGIQAAIGRVVSEPGRWHNSPKRPKQRKRSGAQAADLTDLVDLSDWPEWTRLVVRREPRHPGAQRSLFPSDNFRYWGYLQRPARRHRATRQADALTRRPRGRRVPAHRQRPGAHGVHRVEREQRMGRFVHDRPRAPGMVPERLPARSAAPRCAQTAPLAAAPASARRTLGRLPEPHPGARALLAIAHPR